MAMKLNPQDPMLWNNAGVLSQRIGDAGSAEDWFLRAAKQNPRLTSALYNLVALYNVKGDSSRAAYWQERADKILRYDPYYQFSLGERNAQSGNYDDAVRNYRRAISLESGESLFHFGLARAYFQLGQSRRAGSELALARDLGGADDHSRYQAKLDALNRMRQ
jgi:Flp pilus assembly protein TadD